jgi:hypothetical protein
MSAASGSSASATSSSPGAVEDRLLAAAADYPRETRFLHDLRRETRVYAVHPGGELVGPWVEIYRL